MNRKKARALIAAAQLLADCGEWEEARRLLGILYERCKATRTYRRGTRAGRALDRLSAAFDFALLPTCRYLAWPFAGTLAARALVNTLPREVAP